MECETPYLGPVTRITDSSNPAVLTGKNGTRWRCSVLIHWYLSGDKVWRRYPGCYVTPWHVRHHLDYEHLQSGSGSIGSTRYDLIVE